MPEPGSADTIAAKAAELRPVLGELKTLNKGRHSLERTLRKLHRARKPPVRTIRAREKDLQKLEAELEEIQKRLGH